MTKQSKTLRLPRQLKIGSQRQSHTSLTEKNDCPASQYSCGLQGTCFNYFDF